MFLQDYSGYQVKNELGLRGCTLFIEMSQGLSQQLVQVRDNGGSGDQQKYVCFKNIMEVELTEFGD